MKLKQKRFGELFNFASKSKIQAKEGLNEGKYPFYTSSNILSKYINEYLYTGESLIFGTGGKPSIHFQTKHFATSTDCLIAQPINLDEIYTEYCFYFIQSNPKILEDGFHGAGLKHISKAYISDIKIPLPPLEEQKHIAAVLSKAEALIAERKQSIQLLDEYLKSTFLEMFGDPVKNEKGWEKIVFEGIVAKDCPLTYGIVQPGEEYKEGVPVIRPVDLTQSFVYRKGLKLIDPKISNQFKRTILKGGEILMCVRGTTGIVSIASKELMGCNVTRGIVPIWFDSNYNSLFAFELIKTKAINNLIQELTYGATLKQINLSDLRKIKIINPPLKLQTQFAQIVEKTEALKTQYKAHLQELEQLYGALSQRAFRGEMRAVGI
jgi:type I restriction enzyme S subunit